MSRHWKAKILEHIQRDVRLRSFGAWRANIIGGGTVVRLTCTRTDGTQLQTTSPLRPDDWLDDEEDGDSPEDPLEALRNWGETSAGRWGLPHPYVQWAADAAWRLRRDFQRRTGTGYHNLIHEGDFHY